MRRTLPVLVVLLAALAVAWFLRPTEVGKEPSAAGGVGGPVGVTTPPLVRLPASEAQLEGRSDAKAPEPPPSRWVRPLVRPTTPALPRVRIHGTVRDEDGRGIRGATVYQLGRAARGGTGWVREQDQTDAEGAFSFLGYAPAGTFVCARCLRRRAVFLDGAQVGPDGTVDFVLRQTPPLVVQLVDGGGAPVAYGTVRALPVTHRGADCRFPGPQSAVPGKLEMTGPDGVVTFYFERGVPIVLVPEVEGMIPTPAEIHVPAAEGSFTFEVLWAGGFELKAVDPSGARVRAALWVTVIDPRTGESLAAYRASEDDGALEAEPPLAPGPYHLDVSAIGYEPALVAGLVLPPGPGVVKHTVTLEPLHEPATLKLLLPRLPPEPPGRRRRSDPTVFVSRRDGNWTALGWVRRSDLGWNAAASTATLTLRPGRWEILVCRPQDGSVATVGPLPLRGGKTVERHCTTEPGVSFALYEVLPPDLSVRAVRVRVPGTGSFPPVGSWFQTSIRDAGGLVETVARPGSRLREETSGALLGPYPGPNVVLEVDDWSGRTHRFPVGG